MELEQSSDPGPIDASVLNGLLKEGPRKKVLFLLSRSGKDGASFKEIAQGTGIPPTTLAYHLKVLSSSSLIKRGLKERTGRRDYSAYALTDSGLALIELIASLMGLGAPQKGPEFGPLEMPGLLVTYMTIGPRCLVIPGLGR
ncbi:MAG: winged helix-turn-helix domain-containing protein [Candidatus Thermoplasmatota archaeon]|jgi:DNA-binding transcriptional ArsR family regulator|nr:winged helix-turn-helix domain-containing protein [Candidatus Thermoplasmatota archaeon]